MSTALHTVNAQNTNNIEIYCFDMYIKGTTIYRPNTVRYLKSIELNTINFFKIPLKIKKKF